MKQFSLATIFIIVFDVAIAIWIAQKPVMQFFGFMFASNSFWMGFKSIFEEVDGRMFENSGYSEGRATARFVICAFLGLVTYGNLWWFTRSKKRDEK